MSTTRKTKPPEPEPLTKAEEAYRLHIDEPDERVRARARRAAHGEANRASRAADPRPPVREMDKGGRISTRVVGRLLPGAERGQVVVREVTR